MSFSSPQLESPIKKYIKWNGSEGYFYYWDKTITDEDGVEVGGEIKLPAVFQVIPLDITFYIGGHSEIENKPIRSNEVRHLGSELDVKTSNGVSIAKGSWKSISDSAKSAGGKFGNNIYCMLMLKDEAPELACISVIGSSMQGVMEAKEQKDATFKIKGNGHALTVGKNPDVKKKGRTEYFIPSFKEKRFPATDKMSDSQKKLYDMAFNMDLELQEYIDSKLSGSQEPTAPTVAPAMDLGASTLNAPSPSKDPDQNNELDDLPF